MVRLLIPRTSAFRSTTPRTADYWTRPRVSRSGETGHAAGRSLIFYGSTLADDPSLVNCGATTKKIGASIFFTDNSMAPSDLAVALEQRGFDSLWVAEHSDMPVTRRFSHPLGRTALTREYFDVMDPFVTLSAAAAVTTRLRLGTAICLIVQRDTIQTAKSVASLDRISKGRFLFGIGCVARRGNGRSWRGFRDSHAEDARTNRGDAPDLDQAKSGISRRY